MERAGGKVGSVVCEAQREKVINEAYAAHQSALLQFHY